MSESAPFLDPLNFDFAARGPSQVPPRMLEFPVSPEGAPYLVSSTRSVVWVNKASSQGTIRAAVRPLQGFYQEALEEIATQGKICQWGNIHPATKEGLEACIACLTGYGFEKVDILTHPESKSPECAETEDLSVVPCLEIPEGWWVCVPRDRSFVGIVGTVGVGKIVSLIHNPTRGVAIARP